VGDLWVVCEGRGEMPGSTDPARMVMTIGFDPAKGKFVGSWIGSMMTHLWVYEGDLDEATGTLTLNTRGPSMTPEGGMADYRDVLQMAPDGTRRMWSEMKDAQGTWKRIMNAEFRRK
jgi:hypothetical protein